ncbi:hypothetical protein ESZ50_10320 [Weissella muntiaci]|uniref:Uncharacterized protein n=1 Tax=Weissella muntiaci TaxID=2508881 RepID=A0A6C2C243_9LACO|nr:ArdC-like ssDNA-binding domain-containing protein [Weissella muntiaci]TYC48014.1 hypothetical protein ESZ50_10320 [Weissella muntiaci]
MADVDKNSQEYFNEWYGSLADNIKQINSMVGIQAVPKELFPARLDTLLLFADDPNEPLNELSKAFIRKNLKPNSNRDFVFTYGSGTQFKTVIYDFNGESQSNDFRTLAGALLNATNDLPLDEIYSQEEILLANNRSDLSVDQIKKLFIQNVKGGQSTAVNENTDEVDLQNMIKNKDYKGLSDTLKNGVKNYLNTDQYKNYLKFIAKFHKYSSRNNQLILMQKPEASNVASFKKWKELGRSVQKGSKALYVYAPMKVKKKDANNKPIVDKNGEIQTETFFRLVPVFDVSQTQGKELPVPISELTNDLGGSQNFPEVYRSLSGVANVPIEMRDESKIEAGAKGYYSPTENLIVIKAAMGQEQTIKTLIHEIVHSELHANSQARFGSNDYSVQEFEAESVAYIVANHLGIDTAQYSFGYLASWTDNGAKLEEFQTSLETITNEARSLINKIDETLEKSLSLSKPENKFEERVSEAQQVVKAVSAAVGSKVVEATPKVTSL